MFFIFVYLTLKRLIMALDYTYLKYKDTYTIKNNEAVDLTYHISTVSCENVLTEIKTGLILPDQTVTLNFNVDGKYSVYVSSSTQSMPAFTIDYYYNLITSFVSMIEGIVCGCSPCKDCEECNECEDYLGAFMKAQAFMVVNGTTYQGFYQSIINENACLITEQVLCSLLHEKVYGNTVIKDTMIYLLSAYYFAFYYKDKDLAVDAEEEDYVAIKYKFTKILACMKKIGINPQSIG